MALINCPECNHQVSDQIGVDFTEIADDQLRGVDQWAQPWEMERVG